MRSLVGISGYLLLGLYCIILCHNTLPHQHHISEAHHGHHSTQSHQSHHSTEAQEGHHSAQSHHNYHSTEAHEGHHSAQSPHNHHSSEAHHGHNSPQSHHSHHKTESHHSEGRHHHSAKTQVSRDTEHPGQTNHHDSNHHTHSQGMFGFIMDLLGGHIHLEGGESQLDLYVGKDVNLLVTGIDFSSIVALSAEKPHSNWIEGEPTDEYNLPPPPLYQSGFPSITPVRGPPFIS